MALSVAWPLPGGDSLSTGGIQGQGDRAHSSEQPASGPRGDPLTVREGTVTDKRHRRRSGGRHTVLGLEVG